MQERTPELAPGLEARLERQVVPEHLASRWGSGGVDVLATPQMIGWMEQAAVQAVDPLLPEGLCTVGAHLDVRHLAATRPGGTVTATARLVELEGRRLTFEVSADDEAGPIGQGTHTRYIVRLDEFMARADERGTTSR
jgi:fluoroacetyl-CoA thioesterase